MIGCVEHISMTSITGWAAGGDPESRSPATIEASCHGTVIGKVTASLPRPDIAGAPDCGFTIPIAPPYDVDAIEVVADGRPLPRAHASAGGGIGDIAGTLYQLAPEVPGLMLRVTEPVGTPYDLDICERLIAIYRRLWTAHDHLFADTGSMWTDLLAWNFGYLTELVKQGDARKLCDYLLSIHKRPESWGITQGPESYNLLRNADPGSAVHRSHAALYRGELLSLAEYLGILPVENAGQGTVHGPIDLVALLRDMRAHIGIDPVYPHIAGGLYCLDTGAGLMQQRDLWALYAALRVIAANGGVPPARVCEIGGGLAQACHYARLLGVRQYALIDLPHVSLLQAFQLMRANPGCRIALYDGGDFDTEADICVYPTFMYERAPDGFFGVTLNVDSMPEMGWDNALAYARTAERKCARFLSINQEARGPLRPGARQISVRDVLARTSFRECYRFRSWLRRGYVESLYAMAPPTTPRDAADPPADAARPAAASASPRRLEGHLDMVGPEMIVGWARDAAGDDPVQVDIHIDGAFFSRVAADAFSPALHKAGLGSGRHVFAVRLPVALFDGHRHQVGARIADSGVELGKSPVFVEFPSIAPYVGAVSGALTCEPWVIDSADIDGDDLVLRGWAIPPREGVGAFHLDGRPFDHVAWPLPRQDIHQVYFFHPNAARSSFVLRSRIPSSRRPGGAAELRLSYVRDPGGEPLNPDHDYYLALSTESRFALPQPHRRRRVTGTEDLLLFEIGGYTLVRKIENLLAARFDTRLDAMGAVLDWGCGCGRLLRFLVDRVPPGDLFGTDIDHDNVAWCGANLPGVSVAHIPLLPPSPFQDAQFGFVVGNSVVTHLGETAHLAWLAELARITRAGGLVMVSVHTIAELPRETFHALAYQRLLERGFLSDKVDHALAGVVTDESYYRSTFHTHEYIEQIWSHYFDVVCIVPQFSNNMLDWVVMRKR
jgi:SAM-dependent methyltransferase